MEIRPTEKKEQWGDHPLPHIPWKGAEFSYGALTQLDLLHHMIFSYQIFLEGRMVRGWCRDQWGIPLIHDPHDGRRCYVFDPDAQWGVFNTKVFLRTNDQCMLFKLAHA